uniref:Uncharacterized protein n=1 Tax=Hyaloperonospora arabidopsidis (strain Emoy2) TaxID=559515 RepID=M4BD74_HYAAE
MNDGDVEGTASMGHYQPMSDPRPSSDLQTEEDCASNARLSSTIAPEGRPGSSTGRTLDVPSCGRPAKSRSVAKLDSREPQSASDSSVMRVRLSNRRGGREHTNIVNILVGLHRSL